MKNVFFILSLMIFAACSTTRTPSSEQGAHGVDAFHEQARTEQEIQYNQQFPGGRSF